MRSAVAGCLLAFPLALVGQDQAAQAALFLLAPVGARATSLGTAMAAQSGDGESLWWNPAGLAAVARAEVSLNHSQSLLGTGDALTMVRTTRLGTFAIGANVLQNDGGEGRGEDSLSTGTLLQRNIAIAASYAVRIGRSVRAGITWKHTQLRFDCSGECPPTPAVLARTPAIDVGAQADLTVLGMPLGFGLALRHMGTRRSDDSPDDENPLRIHLGVGMGYALPEGTDVLIKGSLEAVMGADGRPLPVAGIEAGWAGAVFLRGGYVVESSGTESGGASIGLGLRVRRRLQVDFSRSFSGLSADSGQPPVQLALRVAF